MILLESSALIEAFRKKGRRDIQARVHAALISSDAAICEPVLLELFAGARGIPEVKRISRYEETLPILECDAEVWQLAKKHAKIFRAKGLTFSNFDILIFSIAVRHKARLIAMDKTFAAMRKAIAA